MIFKWLKNLFFRVRDTIRSILIAVFHASFQLLLEKLKDVATNAITTLATTDLSNEQKRQEAFKQIQQYAMAQALSIKDREIFLIIEIIYSQLKNDGIIK